MEYYSAIKKNSFGSVLMRWMKLEPIIQSEVSQKDKDHYNILTHIYGIGFNIHFTQVRKMRLRRMESDNLPKLVRSVNRIQAQLCSLESQHL